MANNGRCTVEWKLQQWQNQIEMRFYISDNRTETNEIYLRWENLAAGIVIELHNKNQRIY